MFSFFMFGLLQANVWYLFEHVGAVDAYKITR